MRGRTGRIYCPYCVVFILVSDIIQLYSKPFIKDMIFKNI